jgi:hypothetical protein
MIDLVDLISELREQLEEAIGRAPTTGLAFDLAPIELEVTVVAQRTKQTNGKVRFYVLEAGGDISAADSTTQRIKLTLQPRLIGSPDAPTVSGDEASGGEQ